MTTEDKLKVCMVLSVLMLLWSTIMWSNYIETIKLQSNTIDSLHNELFNTTVENFRHKLTREEILKPNKKINKQYEEYYNHETE
jgi:diacylglycerol kinase